MVPISYEFECYIFFTQGPHQGCIILIEENGPKHTERSHCSHGAAWPRRHMNTEHTKILYNRFWINGMYFSLKNQLFFLVRHLDTALAGKSQQLGQGTAWRTSCTWSNQYHISNFQFEGVACIGTISRTDSSVSYIQLHNYSRADFAC